MELTELNKYKLDYQIAGSFACESSTDGKISIITNSDLLILKYKPNMENDENLLTFDEYYIHCSDYHIADQTGISVEAKMCKISKDRFYRLLMNEIFTPELENTNPHVTKPIAAHWSPAGVYRNSESVIGVVSNTGNVEILVGTTHDWESIANLTENLVEINKKDWKSVDRCSEEQACETHEKRVLQCAATCMAWSPIYENDAGKYIYITVGYINGEVMIWKFSCIDTLENNKAINPPELITRLDFGMERITAVHWCSVLKDTAWIVCGDLEGNVKSILVSFKNANTCEIKEKIDIWIEEDIRTNRILSIQRKENTCFLVIKGAFIILALIDNNTNSLKWIEAVNFGNLYITGIQAIGHNYFMVCMFTGVLKTLEIKLTAIKCLCKVLEVNNNIDWQIHAPRGLLKLPNGYIWGVLLYPCKMIDHLSNRTPLELTFCISAKLDPGKVLKENPTESLENYWELLDIIRCVSAKKNTIPCNWLSGCDKYDEISMYELRVIYWIAVSSHKFLILNPKIKKQQTILPNPEILQKILYFRFRLGRLNYLLTLHAAGKALSVHQLHSIYMLMHNLKSLRGEEFCETYFRRKYLDEAAHILTKADKLQDIPIPDCIVCEIPMTDGKCCKNHLEEYCAISRLQIIFFAKWNCPMCQSMAVADIEDEHPYCPLCDIPFLDYDPHTDSY